MNFPMIAEDILPLIEGDDDSLDTLMLGFEKLGHCTLDNFAMKFGSQPSIPQIYPHQTSNVVKRFRYIGKNSMQQILVKRGSRRSLHQAGSKH